MDLLNLITKLAHKQPELRRFVVPLIREAADAKHQPELPHWDDFLVEKYEGGKKKVPNPNPETRKTYPQVSLFTAIKYPPAMKKVRIEYHQWLSAHSDKPMAAQPLEIKKPPFVGGSKIQADHDFQAHDMTSRGSVTIRKGDLLEYSHPGSKGTLEFWHNDHRVEAPAEHVKHLFAKPEAPKAIEPSVQAEFLSSTDGKSMLDWGAQFDISEITPRHKKALKTYTSSGYRELNDGLRQGGMEEETEELLNALDSAFKTKGAVLPSAVKVKRGVSENHPLVKRLLNQTLKPGDSFKDFGFMSTSIHKDLNWGSYALHISLPKGAKGLYLGKQADGSAISSLPEEWELLLPRNTKIKILSFKNNVIECELET